MDLHPIMLLVPVNTLVLSLQEDEDFYAHKLVFLLS